MLLALAAVLVVVGCSAPSDERRQNRRLVDAALTAVTLKSPKELGKCRKLLDERRAASLLSQENHSKVMALLDKAAAGQWAEAEEGFYEFRKSKPFPE
jgi:hypothetical protein